MLRVSQLKSNGWVKGTIAAVLGHTPVCGIRGKAAKIMWRVSLELDPIMGGFFQIGEIPASDEERQNLVEADRLISAQRAGL